VVILVEWVAATVGVSLEKSGNVWEKEFVMERSAGEASVLMVVVRKT
jgi:hypothetical protein